VLGGGGGESGGRWQKTSLLNAMHAHTTLTTALASTHTAHRNSPANYATCSKAVTLVAKRRAEGGGGTRRAGRPRESARGQKTKQTTFSWGTHPTPPTRAARPQSRYRPGTRARGHGRESNAGCGSARGCRWRVGRGKGVGVCMRCLCLGVGLRMHVATSANHGAREGSERGVPTAPRTAQHPSPPWIPLGHLRHRRKPSCRAM
jgi:hypothetical protein